MDEWLNIVLRQLILYSLPLLVSLTLVLLLESRLSRRTIPHPFFAISWRGTWLPLLTAIAWHRGMIIALPNPLHSGIKAAGLRCLAHALLTLLGLALFSWSLAYSAPSGLPPLHHWWAKLLMFFNLCLVGVHILPLPGLLCGECLLHSRAGHRLRRYVDGPYSWLLLPILAASPILDIMIGAGVVFPVYERLSNLAIQLSR